MTGRNRKDRQPGITIGSMKCSLFVFLICVALAIPAVLVQPDVQNVRAEGSSVSNNRTGDLVVFSQDYTSMSTVPGNMCLAADSMSGAVSNLALGYNATSHCVSLDATVGAVGKLFVGGLSPSLSTTITIDMGMGRTEDHATVNVYAGAAWLEVRLANGTPTDDLEITSNYYTYSNPTLYSATSVTPNVGFNDGGRFEITVVSDCDSRTNEIYLNGVKKLTTPYTRYQPFSLTTVYDPFVNPFVHFAFESVYSGQTAYLQLYSVEQTVPEYAYVTPISNPKLTSFGVDGPHPWDTVDYGLSLLDGGTIWADVGDLDVYSPSEMAALKALIADGWELGIHYSARLYDLPLADAIALMDAETAEITAMFGEPPTTWCSLQGADNITHAEYAYANFGMVSRTGVNGCGAGLSSIANLGDNCWTFWSIASAAGIVVPTFSHQLDVTPAILWSISADKFSTYVSNYESRGVHIIGFREYWEKAQNSYHTVISNVVSDPGVSLSFTVANIGGKSRLLVNAPWATGVQDGSGGDVLFEVSGSGIVMEVEAGDYTVAAGLHADFSADETAAVVGQAVQFTNLSMGGVMPLSCEWDFGDGTGSMLQNPSHSYSSPGTYTVALQVTDSAEETDTETKASYITVTTSPPPNNPPNTPVNLSPGNGTGGVSLTPLLQVSAFTDPDSGDSQAASQWQIRAAAGSYSNPMFDTNADTTHLTGIVVPALSYSATYYWHVRYRDNHGAWSSYSNETSFTTVAPPNQAPSQPDNVSPANGDSDVSLTPTLTSATFSDPDTGDAHAASQWQVTAVAGDYSSPAFDSGADTANLTSVGVPSGVLDYSTTYYWRLQHQDSHGAWSGLSDETSFTTAAPPNQEPAQPGNVSPSSGSTGVGLVPMLSSSAFSDPDGGDTHAACRWQVTAVAGDYSNPVFDSGTDTTNLTGIGVPSGRLAYSTIYFWRVRHQDNRGAWSGYSDETSFTTAAPPNQAPSRPDNVSLASGGTGVSLTPGLTSTAFSDPDSGDTHAASQWQVTAVAGDYSNPVFDSATDTANLTSVNIPSGKLSHSTIYYRRVRHQDNRGAWSDWSAETSFATVGPPVDSTPPAMPTVLDDGPSTTATTGLHATWAATDPESGIAEYQYAIGTSAGDTDVVGWASTAADGVNQTGLSLTPGTTYYFSVKARNGAGLWSAVGVSDGIQVIGEQDTAPDPPESEDKPLPFWLLMPVVLAVGAAAGYVIYSVRKRPT